MGRIVIQLHATTVTKLFAKTKVCFFAVYSYGVLLLHNLIIVADNSVQFAEVYCGKWSLLTYALKLSYNYNYS